jgi:hypothetical protein
VYACPSCADEVNKIIELPEDTGQSQREENSNEVTESKIKNSQPLNLEMQK